MNSSCQCQTGYTAGGCPSGYRQVSANLCFPNITVTNETCERTCSNLYCAACFPGSYGPECLPCPNCNGGTCSDGLPGSGQCTNCPAGAAGAFCQYTRAGTCSGHGQPTSTGARGLPEGASEDRAAAAVRMQPLCPIVGPPKRQACAVLG